MACVLITFPGLHDEMADTMHEVDEAKSVLFEPSLTGFHFWKLDQRILQEATVDEGLDKEGVEEEKPWQEKSGQEEPGEEEL
ncbi:hypothetical protein C1H76_2663 [Elsinoe australis]|uniref:Uncharacterized protein n=1 Tax=Elsinoe australis TaxID=40998 RepID=A0A4U7BB52_9PEZI|nr:hypothetical protein C1H76_2663 [Elsinoe australis]